MCQDGAGWRFGRAAQVPDGAVGVAILPPDGTDPTHPPTGVYVAGNLGSENPSTPGNLVFLNQYDLNGNLVASVKWGGVPNPLRRAVAIKTIHSVSQNGSSSVNFVCVLVQEPVKFGKVGVVLLAFTPDIVQSLPQTFSWSYQPYPGFHGNDFPIAMAVAGAASPTVAITYIAVAVQSEGTTPGQYASQALLWTGGNGAINPQEFDNSRVSYSPGNTIPVGVAIIPPHPNFEPNRYGSVFIAGTANAGTSSAAYFTMGYCIEAPPNGSGGDPVPYMATGAQKYTDSVRPFTATAMAGAFRFESCPNYPGFDGENIYVTGYTGTGDAQSIASNWVTVKWRADDFTGYPHALRLVPEWVAPAPPSQLNAGEYNGVAGLNDYPKAIELRQTGPRSVPPQPGDPTMVHSYIWVTGSTQTANGTYDAAVVQYEDSCGGGSEGWRAQLANVIEGPFAGDDFPVSITSSQEPSLEEGGHAVVFITAQSRSWTGDWDFLHFKYNSVPPRLFPPPAEAKHPEWWIFSSARNGSGPDIPSGLAIYQYRYPDPPNYRAYYKIFGAGTSYDFSPANGGNDSLVVKYSETFP